jgi:type IV secretion system protein VirB9
MNTPRDLSLSLMLLLLASGPAHAQGLMAVGPQLAGSPVPREDPVESAFREFEGTGAARVIHPDREGAYLLFPFGYERPVVHCPRLNACMIALEPGERLTDDPMAGDTERWTIGTSVMGSREQSLLVIVKPQDCDLATNLLIPTDRRVYEMALTSDRCSGRGREEAYTRRVKFWYPDAMRAEQEEERARLASAPAREASLNHEYRVDRGPWWHRKHYPWMPQDVYDDGVRTYVVLPAGARGEEMPLLYSLDGDERQVLNYAMRGDTLVADRVLRRAALVVGSGHGERSVEIGNRTPFRREEGAQQ